MQNNAENTSFLFVDYYCQMQLFIGKILFRHDQKSYAYRAQSIIRQWCITPTQPLTPYPPPLLLVDMPAFIVNNYTEN